MKAIILAAGQGKRLLPLTAEEPKALLAVGRRRLFAWQIAALAEAGVEEIVFVTGYNAPAFRAALAATAADFPTVRLSGLHNPFFAVSDNLASCWLARAEMEDNFFLVNGDTVFSAGIARALLDAPPAPLTLAIDRKPHYDEDDMKVSLDGGRLLAVAKTLPPEESHGESIGVMLFRAEGAALFRAALERAMDEAGALRLWFLSVIDGLARGHDIRVCSIAGEPWCEIDYPLDLKRAQSMVASWSDGAEALSAVR